MLIRNGISLREALRWARALGAEVRHVSGTGEWLIRHQSRSVRHNARRKVASREFVCLLRRIAKQRGPS